MDSSLECPYLKHLYKFEYNWSTAVTTRVPNNLL